MYCRVECMHCDSPNVAHLELGSEFAVVCDACGGETFVTVEFLARPGKAPDTSLPDLTYNPEAVKEAA